jgi:hypothetical protein
MTNECNLVRVAIEAILLLLFYAWNSAPIPGTNLSHCFVTFRQEFQFPINFSANKHFESTSTPSTITSYSRDLASSLSALHEVADLLVNKQCAYHHEFVNSCRPNSKIYSVGDIVFARQAICSDATRGQVNKLMYPFTGSWQFIAKLYGASYELKHWSTKTREKKHASNLSPYTIELIPFQPIDGADNQYGQLYWRFKKHSYEEAGIEGFTPPMPFVFPNQFLTTDEALTFTWPTLAKLNNEFFPEFEAVREDEMDNSVDLSSLVLGFYTDPPPSAPWDSIRQYICSAHHQQQW